MSKTRDDLGRYEEKTPPDELKLIVEELANPVTTIPEISELVESSRESVRQKLHRLADQGEIKKKKLELRRSSGTLPIGLKPLVQRRLSYSLTVVRSWSIMPQRKHWGS